MAYTTNVLSIPDIKGFQFNYENNGNFDKLKFVQEAKREPKVKTIRLTGLSFNPQYSECYT